ncbi:MAG: hypothetical protein WC819_02765 [Parcubacteria group bacterium]|jgi:hypothetical protein
MLWDRIKKHWSLHPLSAAFVVFLGIFVSISLIYAYAAGDPRMDDHYFHFKYAYLLRTEGLNAVNHFDWIYLLSHSDSGSRYAATLFQVSLIPFTYFHDWLLGLYIADAFYLSAALALIYYVLRKAHVRYPLFFIVALFSSMYFIERLLLGRAFVLAVGLIFLELYFAVERKYKQLFLVCIFHVLWHQSTYFMPIFFVGVVEIARYLTEHKMFLRNIASTALATVVGMAFFPGFPQSLFLWAGNIISLQTTAQTDVQTGNAQSIGGGEMASKDFMNYFAEEKMLLLLIVLSSIAVIFIYVTQKKHGDSFLQKTDKKQVIWIYALFVSMISMMSATITMSGRVFDFFIPIAFVLVAFLVTFIGMTEKVTMERSFGTFLKFGIGLYCGILFLNTGINIYALAQQYDYSPARQAAQWVQEHSTGRDKVFLQDWGNFPLMFFENSHNVYSTGIEPMSLKSYDEALYWKYYNMFRYNYYCDKPGDCGDIVTALKQNIKDASQDKKDQVEKENSRKIITSIKNDFDAQFIISGSDVFSETIERNPDLIEDQFHVKSEKFAGKYMEFTVFKLK